MFSPLPTSRDVDMSPPPKKRALDDHIVAVPDAPGMTASASRLLGEVARGYLDLTEEQRHRSRDENVVIKIRHGHAFDLGMQDSINFYDNAGKQARKDSGSFKGNPIGKRPDAMFKAVLVRFVQCNDAHTAQATGPDSMYTPDEVSAFRTIREASQRAITEHSHLVAMRCFRIQVEDDGVQFVKWIFFSTSETAVMQAFRLLRDHGTVLTPGLLLDYDSTPRSGRSKKIHNLLEALSLGGTRESKGKPSRKGGA